MFGNKARGPALALLALILGACTNGDVPAEQPAASGPQIIIGFESAGHDARAWPDEINTQLDLPLEYVRAMSGNLHVYRLPADSGRPVEAWAQALQQRPEVRLAEPDRRMHSQ